MKNISVFKALLFKAIVNSCYLENGMISANYRTIYIIKCQVIKEE